MPDIRAEWTAVHPATDAGLKWKELKKKSAVKGNLVSLRYYDKRECIICFQDGL